ncbi:MAG: tetratricopeptide repeat protein [Spirosomataceae bacterium]
MKKLLTLIFSAFLILPAQAQLFAFLNSKDAPKAELLLTDRGIQIATTAAVNNMYNFNFYEAEKEFKWLKVKYPEHPLGDFMLGLNEWWKIVPDTKQTQFDDQCHYYMDEAIDKADEMLDKNKKNKEAAFFLCAAYAVKGRLYAEREKWVKSAWAGKQSIKYLDISRGEENINPELLFGDGVYNYYSKWIHENYKSMKPLLTFFRKGDKNLGIRQLENVANNAFYSRMEARYFLIQIYAMENNATKSLMMSRQMHALYPNNSFFHRYVARNAFSLGRLDEAEIYAKELLENLENRKYGYGANDGRYGAYILAYVNERYYRNIPQAKFFYQKCINYALENDTRESGYYVASNKALAKIAMSEKDYKAVVEYYGEVMKNTDKKSADYQDSKKALQDLTKMLKAKKGKK